MIDIHTTEFNDARHPRTWQYHKRRFADSHNGWSPGKYSASELADALRYCAVIIETENWATPIEQLLFMGDVEAFLQMSRRLLPEIEGWCIVKHYPDADRWKPVVWEACITQKQAEALAPVIQAHYNAKSPNGDAWGDRFVVERRPAHVHQFLQPWVTAENYYRRGE